MAPENSCLYETFAFYVLRRLWEQIFLGNSKRIKNHLKNSVLKLIIRMGMDPVIHKAIFCNLCLVLPQRIVIFLCFRSIVALQTGRRGRWLCFANWEAKTTQFRTNTDTYSKRNCKAQTFLQRRLLVLLQSFDGDCFQPDTGCRVFLQHVPHILLAKHEQVAITDRSHTGRSSVACDWKRRKNVFRFLFPEQKLCFDLLSFSCCLCVLVSWCKYKIFFSRKFYTENQTISNALGPSLIAESELRLRYLDPDGL